MFNSFLKSITIGVVLIVLSYPSTYAQEPLSYGAEMLIQADNCTGYTKTATANAKSGKTRWDINHLPVTGYGTASTSANGQHWECGFDAPNSRDSDGSGNDLAWGYYTFTFECSDGFSRIFSVDLRDAAWSCGYGTSTDFYVKYDHLARSLKIKGPGTYWEEITTNGVYYVWKLYGYADPRDRTSLLVPVTATNNFSGGQIKMDGTSYGTPKTLNWGWTTNHTIAAITPQNVGGKTYGFRKWSDGNTNLIRSLTIDDQHNSYTYTANFWNAYMSGPSYLNPYQVGTFTAQPSGGVPSYDYTWYRMELGGGEQSLSGGPEPLRPPYNVWVQLPQFDGSQTATSSGIPPGFKMRVDVKDHEGYVISVEKTVYIDLKKLLAQEEAKSEAPLRFALLPNYPNPFNPATAIQYELAEESRVILSVYNLLGEEVRRLVNENQPAGTYSIRWDGTDGYGESVSGGLYITRLEAVGPGGRFVQTGKMLFLK